MDNPHSAGAVSLFCSHLKTPANFRFEMTRSQRVGSRHKRSQLIIADSEGLHQLDGMLSFMPRVMRHSSNSQAVVLVPKNCQVVFGQTLALGLFFLISVCIRGISQAAQPRRCFLLDQTGQTYVHRLAQDVALG